MASTVKKAAAGAILGGSLLFTGGMGLASAAPLQLQDGLVNVAVGNVTILENVNAGVAANVAAAVCGLQILVNVDALNQATGVDEGSTNDPICTVKNGPVTIEQNAGTPGQSGQVPPGNPAPGTQGGPNR